MIGLRSEATDGKRTAYDVIVVGGGNAAMCAAIEARRAGASVLVLEAAPREMRGGNSRHTRNCRYLHRREDNFLTGAYDEEEFFRDLLQVTGGETDEYLARFCIRSSEDLGQWMSGAGVRWQGPLQGTLQLSRTNAFFLGGGKAVLNAYYQTAARLGIDVRYQSEVVGIETESAPGPVIDVASTGDERTRYTASALVVASGGFEANQEWMARYWGEAARNFAVRGTPYNRGGPLRLLLERGARAVGNEREFHAVAVDARGPMFDGGIVTRLDSIPFGIVVNRDGVRFADEGQDFWPKRYASWGGLIARQPGQVVYSILDAKAMNEFMPSLFPPLRANTLNELARLLDLDVETLLATVEQYNAAVRPGTYDVSTLDDCHTEGLEIPKSHWARRIDQPPFFAYPLRPGITFTYYGVGVDERARVLDASRNPLPGIYAAGEIMAGSILGRGYLAGFGMTIGAVFGRIAGREAAKYALD